MSETPKSGTAKKTAITPVCLIAAAAALLLAWRTLAPTGRTGDKTVSARAEGGMAEDNQGAYGLYILAARGQGADEDSLEWRQATRGGGTPNTGADATPIAGGGRFEAALTVGYAG